MNEILRLIIAQQQRNLKSRFPIVTRDTRILPVPGKATVIIGIRRSGKSTWQHEKMEALLNEGIPTESICYIDQEIATELGGRTFTWEIFPFSFREFLRANGKPESISDISSRDEIISAFSDYITKGGMPERLVLPQDTMATMYFQHLVNDVLARDLILRYNIPHPVQLKRLVQMLMNNMSCLTSVNKLKQRLAGERHKLSPELIGDYMDKLNDCYLMFTVPIRSYNTAVQAVNQKKVYCIDHAMARAFSLATSDNKGLALENLVFVELRRAMENVFYYKTSGGDEIDFAVGPDSGIRLIQVCWELGKQDECRQRETGALLDGMQELGLQESWIITAYEEEEYLDKETGRTIHVVPAYKWLLRK